MKKVLVAVVIMALIFSLAACSSQSTNETVTNASLTVKEGKLRVGMDLQYPPFETFDDNNEPMGISVDIAAALAESMGLELEVVNMDFSTLIPALETGDIDIVIATMSILEEREKKVDFSDPYFFFKIIGLMNKDYATANGLNADSSADDLWAIDSTRFVGLAGQISTDIPQQHGFDVEVSVDKAAAITEIVNGRADMLIISPEVVVGANQAHSDTTEVFWAALDVSPIGMAVAEGNSELLAIANAFIDSMDEAGNIYDQLRADYADELAELFGSDVTMDFYIYED